MLRKLSLTGTFHQLAILSTALMIALIGTVVHANWTNPPASPPNNNVPAPIHTGIENQVKTGNFDARLVKITHTVPTLYLDDSDEPLDARILYSNGDMYFQHQTSTGWSTDLRLQADDPNNVSTYYAWFRNQLRAKAYCDQGGGNCATLSGTTWTFNNEVAANAFIYTSDERLKKNIETTEGLEILKELRGVKFNWIDSGKPSYGLIAQEVQQVLPELVHADADGTLAVEYANIIAVLIESIKEQQAQIDQLQAEVEALQE